VFPQPLTPICYGNLRELESLGFKPNWVIVKGGNENELKRFGNVISMERFRRTIEEIMSLMTDFFLFSVAFGSSLAFAEVFNTTMINILERRREIATLIMLGYTVSEISKSLLIETLLLGIVGIVLGFPLSVLTLQMFKMTYRSELFNMPFVIYSKTYVIMFVTMMVVFILSLTPGIRYVARMDIERVTREIIE